MSPEWSERGLTGQEVAARAPHSPEAPDTTQSFAHILRRKALTRLNFLLVILGAATLSTGSAPDATFLGIALINTVVGAFQEMQAKRKLESLAVVNAPRARVVRDGETQEISPDDVVVDDLLDLRPGDQLTADAVVIADSAELDESLATGESDTVTKRVGDQMVSGSYVVEGSVLARVTHTGADSYAHQLAQEARRFSLTTSELVSGTSMLLKWLTLVMVVIAPILFFRQLQSEPWRVAIRTAVAGLVGMIPEGLILLTTIAFLAAAVRLGRRHVLVQELPAVETLARVDSLCVDKTGTLTEGGLELAGLQTQDAVSEEVRSALASLAAIRGANATMQAIGAGLGGAGLGGASLDGASLGGASLGGASLDGPGLGLWEPERQVAFSSARKWSGATFAGHGTWVLGAPEMVGGSDPEGWSAKAATVAGSGARVLVVGRSGEDLTGDELPADLEIVGTVELSERTRPAVADTLGYFADEQVTVRVISGDAPTTVQALARKVGLRGADRAVDARTMPEPGPALNNAVEDGRIFGRVTPEQKRDMVEALQERDYTVAMTGDGVNDVLALKSADLGIAMGSGSAVSRGVAQLVLLDDDFDVMPSVVAEGRRVLGNIETVASLFLVKNVYSLVISVVIAVTGWPFPYLPRHLTLISAVGIGIPGVFLALGPNERRFTPGYLRRVLVFSVLAGSLTSLAVMLTYAGAREEGLSGDASRTAAIIVTVVVTLWVLAIACRPMNRWKALLVVAMGGLFVLAYLTPGIRTFFSLQHRPSPEVLIEALAFGAGAALLIDVLSRTPFIKRFTVPQDSPTYRSTEADASR